MSRLLLFTFTLCLLFSGCISKEPRTPASENKQSLWWAASDHQVQTAMCRQALARSKQGLITYFAELEKQFLANSEGGTVQIFDLKLVNQPGSVVRGLYEMLSPGATFNQKVKQVTNPKERFQIPETCTSAACVVEAIFGPTVGLQMLYLKVKFELNSSPYSFDDSELFSEDELWDIIAAVELLPKDVTPFHLNQKLTRYKRGLSSDTTLAEASMGYYDRWAKRGSLHRQYIAFHEFAHLYADSFLDNLGYIDAWLTAADWQRNEVNRRKFRRTTHDKEEGLISGYAKTNPAEDFAEAVTAYRLNPNELKAVSPARYNFIRDSVFDGIEFTHSEACEQRKPFALRKIEEGKISFKNFTNEHLNIIAKNCQPEYVSTIFGHLPRGYFQSCVQSQGLKLYFWLIEQRPIPRNLMNDQFARSAVTIQGLENEVTRRLNQRVAKSIWNVIDVMNPYPINNGVCKTTPWKTLKDKLIETEGIPFMQKPLAMEMYRVSPAKIEIACQEILSTNSTGNLSEGSILIYLNKK